MGRGSSRGSGPLPASLGIPHTCPTPFTTDGGAKRRPFSAPPSQESCPLEKERWEGEEKGGEGVGGFGSGWARMRRGGRGGGYEYEVHIDTLERSLIL